MTAADTYLVADLFCGAGGSSTGAKMAIAEIGGTMELVAVNHWNTAIATHAANHPTARHLVEDVSMVDPEAVVEEGRLDLLMASPECKFYSRARGGKPIHDQGRMNPWAIHNWLTKLDVRCVLIENVPEFVKWGPLKPDGRYHLTQAAIAINADTWVNKTQVHRQFTLFHEAGHSLAVNHEGPVMSPVAFGIGPFTEYGSACANQNYNCLASLYDVADYDSWDYNPVTNTGTNLGIQNSNTSRVDRSMIGSYYGDRAAQPTDTCIGNPSPGVLRVTAIDTTRVNTSNWAYLYKWNGTSWIHQTGKFVSLTHSPAFGERLQVDFTIGSATGDYKAGMISHKNSTGWNYTEPIEWTKPITVSSYTNSDIHPPCTIIPRRGSSNGSHLNWVQSSQNVDNVVVEFRAMKGYSTLTSLPTLTWTFVANVSSGTQMWHIFASKPPDYARFAYRLKAENASAQSLYSDWVLVEPWDPGTP